MKVRFLYLLPLLTASCAYQEHLAVSSTGNYERDRNFTVGGTGHIAGADGSSMTHDHRESFKDAVQGAVLLGGSIATASVNKAKEITSQQATKQAQQTARNASNNATKVQLGGQVPVKSGPDETVTFPPIPKQ